MQTNFKKLKNLFLRQSYLDAWEDYQKSLRKPSFPKWDFVILTASNEEQANNYAEQIKYRQKKGVLPDSTKFVVLPDPEGKRVGSGGATFHVLKYIAQIDTNCAALFANKRILVIHSGGDSKRAPQYSACGKLFSPVPRELPDRRGSTLFDEFIIGMSGVPSRIPEGMLVLSGDVLLLFNPLQIDFQSHHAAAISIKKHVSTGKNHGVFLNDGNDYVGKFLHKQPEGKLRKMGAVNGQDCVDLDTGAVIFDVDLLEALFSLISTDHQVDEEKFKEFVNERARVSFYGDFLYPLAKEATLEDYLKEAPEGTFCEELLQCRRKIWEALHGFDMKLLCLAPAEFVHFGTTRELLSLVTREVEDYEFLDWKKCVKSNVASTDFAVNHSLILAAGQEREKEKSTESKFCIERDAYIENSYILGNVQVGESSIVSNVSLQNVTIPPHVALHGLKLKNGKYVVRIYGIEDNPKDSYPGELQFLGNRFFRFMEYCQLKESDFGTAKERSLWFAKLYPICDTLEEALDQALCLYRMVTETASVQEIAAWKSHERISLYESFNQADVQHILVWEAELENKIQSYQFLEGIKQGVFWKDLCILPDKDNQAQYDFLMQLADAASFSVKIRLYYYLSRYMKQNQLTFRGNAYDRLENLCFQTIQREVSANAIQGGIDASARIEKDDVEINLPLRVNWGGGWTDTPPYCNEQGGVVLNAALKLHGQFPVKVIIKRISDCHIEFESQDIGVFSVFHQASEIQDCHNPYDSFALHKAALLACGIIPLTGPCDLEERLRSFGGGIYLSTQMLNVPKGSGLGTSSILAGACVKGLYEFFGMHLEDQQLYGIVLGMEQIMSTGGGWQDQIGGLTNGIKFIVSKPGMQQRVTVKPVMMPEEAREELNQRFALIYTGQRRLARNLLREVVGNYIGNRKDSLDALHDMKRVAALMRFELEQGDIDGFAELLNAHWDLSKKLDSGSTNTCIDQIFLVCEDLIDGKFIAGAGGGGFLQVILKKGVTHQMLQQRLNGFFQDSGVSVWDCELI